jgi:hypothetical protein
MGLPRGPALRRPCALSKEERREENAGDMPGRVWRGRCQLGHQVREWLIVEQEGTCCSAYLIEINGVETANSNKERSRGVAKRNSTVSRIGTRCLEDRSVSATLDAKTAFGNGKLRCFERHTKSVLRWIVSTELDFPCQCEVRVAPGILATNGTYLAFKDFHSLFDFSRYFGRCQHQMCQILFH